MAFPPLLRDALLQWKGWTDRELSIMPTHNFKWRFGAPLPRCECIEIKPTFNLLSRSDQLHQPDGSGFKGYACRNGMGTDDGQNAMSIPRIKVECHVLSGSALAAPA